MKHLFIVLLFTLVFTDSGFAQKPKDGVYTYAIAFAEWGGRSLGSTCQVRIKGDSIYVINDGSLTGRKGEIIDAGVIMKHKRTGKWIIGHNAKDVLAKEIGGCSEGPHVIEFKKKRWWTC
ncbi:MAG: hypothetical protein EOO88_55555 [Pedobacter sp.]|nr:MAG: hypothetical protein EOO88_55555 [Pedobacter sp.]